VNRVLDQLVFARHVPPAQMARRLQLELLRRWRVRLPPNHGAVTRDATLRADAPLPLMPPRGGATRLEGGGWRFRFLDDERPLPWPIPWDLPGTPARDQLWKMNLHYMEYLESLPDEDFARLIEDWIERNPPYQPAYWRDAWNSYTTAIRVVVWLQQLALRRASLDDGFVRRVAREAGAQIAFLGAHLETDLRGNHLIKNIKALLWGARCLETAAAAGWRRQGARLLCRELEAQILPDGVHCERSPSYHCQVLVDLVECRQVLEDGPLRTRLDQVLGRMATATAALCHPDGQVAQLNDSGLSMAYRPGVCLAACAAETGGATPRPDRIALEVAGYYGRRTDDALFIADCGPIGPDSLVAHGHADMLSFEWSVKGLRMIVDPGVFEYNPGPHRAYARAAASHNTVTLDDAEPCAFFGAFRCGRRAHASVRAHRTSADGGMVLEGTHDGFARLPGRPYPVRRFTVTPDAQSVVIEDRIEDGRGQAATARFLFHPDCALVVEGERARIRRANVEIELIAEAPLRREQATWSPDMGVLVAADRLAVRFSKSHRTILRLGTDAVEPEACGNARSQGARPGTCTFDSPPTDAA
jgi:uncharacterized heparinase superfamily protein